jgi:acetolactate synthase-1/2/3 large subunit
MKDIDLLFDRIREATGIEDIGYHKIENGKLKPIHKTNTDILGIEKWKKVHAEHPVYINETKILMQVINTKKPVFINDTNNNPLSADAFFLLGVDSIIIVPILNEDNVRGIICIVSIGKVREFSLQEVSKCESLVNRHLGHLLSI